MIYLINDKVQLMQPPNAYVYEQEKPIGTVESIENPGTIDEKILVVVNVLYARGPYKVLVSPDSLMLISRELVDRSSLTVRHIKAYIEMGWIVKHGSRQLLKCSEYITDNANAENFVVYETTTHQVHSMAESMFMISVHVEPTPNEMEYSFYLHKETGKVMVVNKKDPEVTALVNSDSYELVMAMFVAKKAHDWVYTGCSVFK